MKIRECYELKWDMSANAYEEMLAGNADADANYLDASITSRW